MREFEKERYYVGVDGGGTKTAIVACDRSGAVVASSVSGPLNYNFIGVDEAVKNLKKGILSLGLQTESIAAVGIGDPSIDDEAESKKARLFCSRAFELLGVPIYVRSDAYMTLFALTKGEGRGVLVISGTGAMAIGEDEGGRTRVAGGWGRLSDDEGSGYYIGISGIRASLRSADGIASDTLLLNEALNFYGCRRPRELIDVFYGEDEPNIAGFSKAVSVCAEKGDPIAREILLSAARFLADYAEALMKKCNTERVGVYGSVLCKDKVVRGEFERLLRSRFEDVSIEEPSIDAQRGAALYARINYEKNGGEN